MPRQPNEEPDSFCKELFDNLSDGIFLIDLEGNYLLVNPAYAEIYGYKIEEMYHLSMRKTWYSVDEWDLVFREMRGRKLVNILQHFRRKDDSSGWVELSINTRYDDKGNTAGYYGSVRDVTERRRVEMVEKEASERAEFLIDLMVHDLNNINQGMMLPLELVAQDRALNPKHKIPIEMAIAQLQRSTELIKSVKKLQLVIQQPVKLEKKDLYDGVQTAAEAVKRAFPEKTIDLNLNFKPGEVYLSADDFLPDLFFNLFHNAVKFDKKRSVTIEVLAGKAEGGKINVSVSDHGSGIPDEEKVRVLLRKRGGRSSGVGLTLVKYLIERYNGAISLRDRIDGKADQGTNVYITFLEG